MFLPFTLTWQLLQKTVRRTSARVESTRDDSFCCWANTRTHPSMLTSVRRTGLGPRNRFHLNLQKSYMWRILTCASKGRISQNAGREVLTHIFIRSGVCLYPPYWRGGTSSFEASATVGRTILPLGIKIRATVCNMHIDRRCIILCFSRRSSVVHFSSIGKSKRPQVVSNPSS